MTRGPVPMEWNLRRAAHASSIVSLAREAASVLLSELAELLLAAGRRHAKIADFGLARFHVTANAAEMTAETGSYRWMAPEVIRHEPYDERCDVYSFAMVTYNMLHGAAPWAHLNGVAAAKAAALDLDRPPVVFRVSLGGAAGNAIAEPGISIISTFDHTGDQRRAGNELH